MRCLISEMNQYEWTIADGVIYRMLLWRVKCRQMYVFGWQLLSIYSECHMPMIDWQWSTVCEHEAALESVSLYYVFKLLNYRWANRSFTSFIFIRRPHAVARSHRTSISLKPDSILMRARHVCAYFGRKWNKNYLPDQTLKSILMYIYMNEREKREGEREIAYK